jgi:hypothetical protein
VKALLLLLALVVLPAAAQDEKKAPPKKKPAASQKMPVAKGHTRPTPEQIRKFNQLEKKQGK